jgi:putative transposase
MRAAGLRGVSRRRRFITTTQGEAKQRPAADLVNREFTPTRPIGFGWPT